ncbi:MAG: hypothetical protein QOC61_2044 [Acidobacteriota bacterium]|jgi:predicted Zn finger-like uncharacterized protein|nr:hypothetical protein [Acidobacteriota bacterium]MDT7781428.1 hypothetical protein [Acidobacteriota bacterium]
MIVTCHNCTTQLQFDSAKVPARPFTVRCPKCQQIINAQPPAQPAQRDAIGAMGDLPASTRSQQEMSAKTAAPLLRDEPAPVNSDGEVLRMLASLLQREAAGASVVGERRAWERRRALVCVGSAYGGDVERALGRAGYGVFVATNTAQAVERMREEQLDVVVLDPEFDIRAQGTAQVSRELIALRTAERRRIIFVLISNTARTGDAHAAFLAGANLVVSMKEVEELPRALEKNIRDLNELYRDFNKALGLAEL